MSPLCSPVWYLFKKIRQCANLYLRNNQDLTPSALARSLGQHKLAAYLEIVTASEKKRILVCLLCLRGWYLILNLTIVVLLCDTNDLFIE